MLYLILLLPLTLAALSLIRNDRARTVILAAGQALLLALLSDYYSRPDTAPQHILVVNYAGIDMERLPEGLRRLAQIWEEPSCMTN